VEGGWMHGLAMRIATVQGNQLAVAVTYDGLEFKSFLIDGVIYYLLPAKSIKSYQKNLEPLWEKVCLEFNPDIIHIHGTEYTHGLACMRASPLSNYVVSIQGMVSIISRYCFAGITIWEILKHITFRDFVKFDTLFQAKRDFKRRGKFEKEYLERTNNVIGRTSWDYAHVKAINPKVNYHFCNESLRGMFYKAEKWDINNKSTHTIFLSQAYYPIKGLHQVLKAVALLKSEYPKIDIRIAGSSITLHASIIDKIKLSGYGSYIRKLIKELDLDEHVKFIGILTEKQMLAEYKNAHIFICPSSIENSPNSLGEAQFIGVPCIASYVGGIPDMVTHGETGLLYRFEEVEMLSENIRRIFNNDTLALQLSKNGINVAEKRHNSVINLKQTIDIYYYMSLHPLGLEKTQ
jgi:glycosyltransferase involved in cell wall biosynthesis